MRTALLLRAPGLSLPTANLLFRYDGSDASSITDAGSGAVSAWNDVSGNGRHLSQATGANRPTTGVATLNGRNGIRFTGGSSQILSTGTISAFGPAKTVYVVARMRGSIPNTSTYHAGVDSNQVSYLNVGGGGASGLNGEVYAYDGTARHATGWITDAPMCWTARLDGTTSSSSVMRRNGVNLGSAFTASSAAGNQPTVFTIGGSSSACGPWDIFEVIGYSVKHTDAEVLANEAILNAKWAFGGSLAFSGLVHPQDYFDFSQTAGMTISGGLISSVANLGVLTNAAIASGTARPTSTANAINGKAVATFDGSANVMTCASPIENRGSTVVAIITAANLADAYPALFGPSSNNGFLLRMEQTSGKMEWLVSHVGNGGKATTGLTANTATVVSGGVSASREWAFTQGKAANGSNTSAGTPSGTSTILLGMDAGLINPWHGTIAALAYWPGFLCTNEQIAYATALAVNGGWGL